MHHQWFRNAYQTVAQIVSLNIVDLPTGMSFFLVESQDLSQANATLALYAGCVPQLTPRILHPWMLIDKACFVFVPWLGVSVFKRPDALLCGKARGGVAG